MTLQNILMISQEYENNEPKYVVLAANLTNVTVFESASSEEEAFAILEIYKNLTVEGNGYSIQEPIVGFLFGKSEKLCH